MSVLSAIVLLTTNVTELINEVDHAIGIDGIVPRIATLVGTDSMTDVTQFLQDIKPLETDGCSFLLQEAVGNLCIPKYLIRIHVLVRITTTGIHTDIGRERKSPVEFQITIQSVTIVPGVAVVTLLHVRTRVVVVDGTESSDVQPVIAVSKVQTLTNAQGAGRVFLHFGVIENLIVGRIVFIILFAGFQCHCAALATTKGTDISHSIIVNEIGIGRQGEILLLTHTGIEHHISSGIPVAINVFRAMVTYTRRLVINLQIADGILCLCKIQAECHTLLSFRLITTVPHIQTVRPARF